MQPQEPNKEPVMDIQPSHQQQNPRSNDLPTLPSSMTYVEPKRSLPLLPILTAVVVAVAVIGLSAFAFIQAKHKKPQPNTQQTGQKEQQAGRVSTEDVDKVKEKIDQNMNGLHDATDFTADDLSTSKMGGL